MLNGAKDLKEGLVGSDMWRRWLRLVCPESAQKLNPYYCSIGAPGYSDVQLANCHGFLKLPRAAPAIYPEATAVRN